MDHGYPYRIATLARLLGRIVESGLVWHADAMQIAETFRKQALKAQ